MRAALIGLMAAAVVAISPAPARPATAPAVFTRCVKCHGQPGAGGTRAAPDLAETRMNPEQFAIQVRKGSKWPDRPPKHPRYRRKEMPAQLGVTGEQIEDIYRYLVSMR